MLNRRYIYVSDFYLLKLIVKVIQIQCKKQFKLDNSHPVIQNNIYINMINTKHVLKFRWVGTP